MPISFVTPQHARGKVKRIYDKITKVYGMVPDYFLPFSSRPQVLESIWKAYQEVVFSSNFDEKVRGMIRYEVAKVDGCPICRDGHRNLLRMYGLSDEEIFSLDRDIKSTELEDRTKHILILSHAIASDPHSIDDKTVSAFRLLLSDEVTLQISAIVNIHKFLMDNMHALRIH